MIDETCRDDLIDEITEWAASDDPPYMLADAILAILDDGRAINILHNGRSWRVVWRRGSFFAKDDRGRLTGPYYTADQAKGWVRSIRP